MIVESFGPPGVGKTMFSHVLRSGRVSEAMWSRQPLAIARLKLAGLPSLQGSEPRVSGSQYRVVKPTLDISQIFLAILP